MFFAIALSLIVLGWLISLLSQRLVGPPGVSTTDVPAIAVVACFVSRLMVHVGLGLVLLHAGMIVIHFMRG